MGNLGFALNNFADRAHLKRSAVQEISKEF